MKSTEQEQLVRIPAGSAILEGNLAIPPKALGFVVFAHGSGSSRHSPRNRFVAEYLQQGGLGTLLLDLLTAREDEVDALTGHLRFDIPLLADRLAAASAWLTQQPEAQNLRIGYFGASTGAGAALVAAARQPENIGAIVSRGGRPDLAGPALPRVQAPVLLIVGGDDQPVIHMNQEAMRHLRTESRLEIIPGATHLFEEPGALPAVARLARDWFQQRL